MLGFLCGSKQLPASQREDVGENDKGLYTPGRVIGGAFLVIVVTALLSSWSDIVRYMRMRNM